MNVNSSPGLAGLNSATQSISQHSERIASGSRINSAADDAAGSAISTRINSQVRGYDQSIRNANDGVSLLQVGGAALEGITEGVQRIRELSLQASNGTLNDSDRSAINKEAQQLISEISRTVETTAFNGKSLLSETDAIQLQVGAEGSDSLDISTTDFEELLSSSGFNDLDLSSAQGANQALSVLDQVQDGVNSASASFGAGINRLESTINSLGNASINAQASQSRIQDADIAKEVSDLANEQVKRDASLALQTLANQQRGGVLKLLEGL